MSRPSREEIMDVYNAAQRLLQMSRFNEAAGYLSQCLSRCEVVGDDASCETLLEELAVCYERAERYDDSIAVLRKLLTTTAQRGPTRRCAIIHHNMGFLCELKKDFDKAEEHFRTSSQIAGEAGDRRGRAVSLTMLAQVLHGAGRGAEAMDCLMSAINLLQTAQAPELETVLEYTRMITRAGELPEADTFARKRIHDPETLRRFLDS